MTAELKKDLPIDQYHTLDGFLSKSAISKFNDCPARYEYFYLKGGEQKQTDSLRLGNAMHVMALEPELWQSQYHVLPETYFNDKGVENPWKQDARMQVVQDEMMRAGYEIETVKKKTTFKKTARSKIILRKSEVDTVEQMAEALTRNSYALSLLKSPGYAEASIFWENENGQKLKTRPDYMRNDGLLLDIKTAKSVKPEIFFKDAFNFDYHLSAALAWEGYQALYEKEPDNYVYIAVETEGPFFIECYEVTKPMDTVTTMNYLDYGKSELRRLLADIQVCTTSNVWPQYQEKIGSMKIPSWALQRFIQEGRSDV